MMEKSKDGDRKYIGLLEDGGASDLVIPSYLCYFKTSFNIKGHLILCCPFVMKCKGQLPFLNGVKTRRKKESLL